MTHTHRKALRPLLLLLLCLLWPDMAKAQTEAGRTEAAGDSVAAHARFIHRLGVAGRLGYIYSTNSFLSGDNRKGEPIRHNFSGHLEYAAAFRPGSQTEQVYPGTYQGAGLAMFGFGNYPEVGTPVGLYVFQGGRLARLAPRLTLDYRWGFGVAFGWHPFWDEGNEANMVIGSKTNAYMNLGVLLNYALSHRFDLRLGVTGTHFSNGNTRYPNGGLNMTDFEVGLAYNFNRRADELQPGPSGAIVPAFPRHVSYDLTLFGSWRRKVVNAPWGQAAAPGTYGVAGFSLAPMYNLSYKFRAGVSLDGLFDGSAGITASEDSEFHTPKAGKQMSLGLSARGEFVAPFFSINIGLGANILHNGGDQKAFYQTLALKMRVTHDAYLHVGYNLKNFHDPNFLMLGVGYTFGNRRPLLR